MFITDIKIVRNPYPLQQGLRPFGAYFLIRSVSRVRNPYPLQQGLRQFARSYQLPGQLSETHIHYNKD